MNRQPGPASLSNPDCFSLIATCAGLLGLHGLTQGVVKEMVGVVRNWLTLSLFLILFPLIVAANAVRMKGIP